MKDKQAILLACIKYGGIFELFLAGLIFSAGSILPHWFGIETGLPLLYQMAGVELFILGFLLWYSAKDIERYLIIILGSCVFRFIMPLWPELYAVFTLWPNDFAIILIPAIMYDIGSAGLTLVLLKQQGYLSGKSQ